MTSPAVKIQARRRGSDVAGAWARQLRLRLLEVGPDGKPEYKQTGIPAVSAKAVLLALTQYVDENGHCYPSTSTLADDTDQSYDSVARRLADLEYLGLIVRFRRFRDDAGRVNFDGHGRETSPEIRLLFDATQEAVDAKLRTRSSDSGGGSAEAQGAGFGSADCAPKTEALGSAPLPTGGPHSCAPLNPHLNQDSPPNPPPGGVQAELADEKTQQAFRAFAAAYPQPITDMGRAMALWKALSERERSDALLGAKGYRDLIERERKSGRNRAVKDAHRWLSGRMWEGYLIAGKQAEVAAQMQHVAIDSEAGKAWSTLHRIAHVTPLETAGAYLLMRPLSAQALAFASAPAEDEWLFIPATQHNQTGAWAALLNDVLAGKARPPLVRELLGKSEPGFMAPWAWPPRRDGSTGPPPQQECPDAELADYQ